MSSFVKAAGASGAVELAKREKRRSQCKKYAVHSLFLAPALVLFTAILMNSVVQAVIMSVFDWNGIAGVPMEFVGLDNFKGILSDPHFGLAMRNVLIYIVQGTLVQMPLAFFLALVVSKKIRGTRFYKTAFFLPVIVPMTAVGLMWVFILLPSGGAIDSIMRLLGNPDFNVDFLGNPSIAMYSVVMVSAWVYIGYNMVIFASGMTAIPEDIYEAAKIDGVSRWQEILYITIPMMKETFKIYLVLMVTGSLKTFDLIFVMTNGGPNGATEAPAIMMYKEAFRYSHYGYGNAIATIILVLGLAFSLLSNRYFTGKE